MIMLHLLYIAFTSFFTYYSKIRCMDLPTFIQNNLTLLERYLFASDQKEFLNTNLTLPQERKFFDFLLQPLADNELEIITELPLSKQDKLLLLNSKVQRELDRASTPELKQKLIAKIKELRPFVSFDYPKPAEVAHQGEQELETGKQGEKSAPKFESEATVEAVVERALKENPENINKLSNYGLKNLPIARLRALTETETQFLFSKPEVLRSLDPEAVADLFSNMLTKLSEQKHTSQDEQFPQELFLTLTFQQLQALKRRKPKLFDSHDYHLQIFKLNYQHRFKEFKEIATLTLDQRTQKKNLCKSALDELRTSGKEFYDYLIEKLTEEILLIDEANVDSDLQLFLAYLVRLRNFDCQHLDAAYRSKRREEVGRNKYLNRNQPDLYFLESSRVSQADIIAGTVVSLFKAGNEGTLEALAPYLSRQFLVKEETKVKLALGMQKDIADIHSIFTTDQLSAIRERREITLLPSNRKQYSAGDEVVLQVKLKNVKKLTKKVYFIDMEKQLLQNGNNIHEQINLKFLVPEQQEILSYDSADAFEEITKEIPFKELDNKLGEFILELEGEGVSSRAVIRKGKIVLQNRPTATGHELSFFDGEGKPISELVLWRDGKRLEVKGTYLIPYGPQGREQLIAVSNNYAEQLFVDILTEAFVFSCDYLYHSESFIVGNKARIVLHPSLKLNDQPASLSRLRKVTITLSTINHLNIASSTPIENVVFSDKQDYVLQFPVKAYLRSVSVVISGEVELINREITPISHSTSIAIDLEESNDNFADLYLRCNHEGEYTVQVRGKNGESIPRAGISLSYEQFGINFSFSKDLITDAEGEITLGKLAQVVKLTVRATQNSFTSVRTWQLNNYGDSISYGGNALAYNTYKVYLQEGDDYTLPLPCPLSLNDIIFEQQHSYLGIYYNRISDLKLTPNRLTLPKLTSGTYSLVLLRFNRKIDIEVIKGKDWIGGKIITEDNQVYKLNRDPSKLISLGDIKAEVKQDGVEYSIDIIGAGDLPSDLRAHVFAKNYLDSELPTQVNCEARVCCPRPDIDTISFRQNAYFNNKRLSDETAYVLNRKTQEATNGNNLQKPHIFLKRIEVRATSEKEEQLEGEGRFDDNIMLERACLAKCAAPRMYDCFGASAGYGAGLYRGGFSSGGVTLNRNLNSHNNFLHRVGHLSANLSKIHSIRVPKGYSHITVYLISNTTLLRRDYALPEGKPDRLKLTHTALRDEDKKSGWTMSREIYQVRPGEEREISRSSTWTTVALTNVVEYAKLQGLSLPQWITSWSNYSQQKKIEVYDKELCHQFNFFIYRNDQPFFSTVVRPFIQNKLRKTFIDHYLLDNQEQLIAFSNAHKLNSLNYFERAILVGKLRDYGLKAEAESLASSLELPLKSSKQTSEEFKRFFETVLNAKKESQGPPPPPAQPFAFGTSTSTNAAYNFSHLALSGAPPPMVGYSAQAFAMSSQPMMDFCSQMRAEQCAYGDDMMHIEQAKESYKPGFKETEKTKEYTETTYSGITDPLLSASLVPASRFWAELARHLATSSGPFLSDKFSELHQKIEFVLACSVLSNDSQAEYELANKQGSYVITAKNGFLVFVREVKSLPFEESKSVVLNQRFFDPRNRHRFDEEGTQVQKDVENFLVQRPYTLQTLLTNISGSNLEVQLLMDIPEGALPLLSHEQTQIINVSLPAYNTKSFERTFYFPEEGTFPVYPANASKGRTIIARAAQSPAIVVTRKEPAGKLESLDNILRGGSDANILGFLANKNIFDPNVFDLGLILWKLKDKQFFYQVIKVLKERRFYSHQVWSFALLHGDLDLAREYLANDGPQLGDAVLTLPIFEYYPYYSRRAHKFADENKSTIRVKEFRENYGKFLLAGIFSGSYAQSHFVLTHIYYLLLQDRIAEARALYSRVSQSERKCFALQYDYIDCFLDMYEGASSGYKLARKVSEQYLEYPVLSWRKLFADVYNTLEKSGEEESEESTHAEEVAFSASVVNAGSEVRVTRPAGVKIVVNVYSIDIELYFSEFPFSDIAQFSAIKPTWTNTYEGEFRVEKIERKQFSNLKDIFVEVYEQKANTAPIKISNFFWVNPDVKVKINEREGTLKVFFNGKKCSTSYCKVYSRGSKGQKFSRDGYTDVASTFRYALDVKDIQEFSILVLTDHGGSIHKVRPPSLY